MALKKKVKTPEPESEEILDEEVLEEDTSNTSSTQDSSSNVSIDIMEKALSLVSNTFKLSGDYHVTGFVDKGNSVKLSVENDDFSIDVVIKHPYEQGVYDV